MSKNLPVEGIAYNQHMHHMHIVKDPGWLHKHRHHNLVHSHNKHSIDSDQQADPIDQRPTRQHHIFHMLDN